MRLGLPGFLTVIGWSTGCGQRCPEVSRLDGGWAVFSDTDPANVSGSNSGRFPWEDVFVGGWSEWDLSYLPSRVEFQLEIDGQPFVGTYVGDEADCESFTLSFDGRYLGDGGSTHDFTWTGALTSAGVHLDGTFDFTDTWADPLADASGDLSVAGGIFTGNVRAED